MTLLQSDNNAAVQLSTELWSRATFVAKDVVLPSEEFLAHQGDGAFHAVKAFLMPLTLLKWDVFGTSESWKRVWKKEKIWIQYFCTWFSNATDDFPMCDQDVMHIVNGKINKNP